MSNWLNGLMGKALASGQKSVTSLVKILQTSESLEERKRVVEDLRHLSDYPENVKVYIHI